MPAKRTQKNQTDWLEFDFPASPMVSPITIQPVADHHKEKPVEGAESAGPNSSNIEAERARKPNNEQRRDFDAETQKARRNKKVAAGLKRVEGWVPEEVSDSIRNAAAATGLRMSDLIANTLKLKFGKNSKK